MTSTERIKNGPSARVYPLKAADGDNAVQVFSSMFTRTDDVRVSFDGKSRALIAVARPEQHELIKAIVDQLEPTNATVSTQTLEVYPLSGMDGLTAVQFAEGLLQSVDPAATVSWQKTSRQLIVSATADGHQQLNAAMSRLQENDAREMDVIQLRLLSASSAQNAIEGLYGDSFTNDDDYPVIQADEDLQQLLIRGSKKQLLDIRTLLIKMGETGLSEQAGGNGTNRNLRVIAMPGDVEPTLRKIQDLWPRVRKNPIRVIRPEGESSAQPPADAPAPGGNGHFSVPAESLPEETDEAAKQPAKPDSSNDAAAPEKPASEKPVNLQAAEASPAAPALGDVANEQSSPVIIIPGPGRLTIASDDLDALDQLESILRATTPFSPGTGVSQRNRDFSIYQLRNAGAEEVAETLESIYESRAGALAFGSVIIVPETRMNALIVYGGRTDRDRIEQLLEILDTEKLPDSGRIFRTEVIPVKHADASKIEDVLRGVYRTEMSAGGTRRAIEIPAGIDSSVASVLRQINAASSAPLLTIEVQVETNSLVVKAPQNLIDELRELITKLDDTAQTNRSRGVTLVPLKQTNTRRVMRILNDVLDD
jgi:type II secretory pathway component GspD/PulD (secretin)